MGEGDRRVIGAETERTVTSGQRKGKHREAYLESRRSKIW